jgi:hypothetical protein
MLNRSPLSRFEVSAYLMLVIGVFGDHLSTGLALANGNTYESNLISLNLMQNGLWFSTDAILILISVLATYFLSRLLTKPFARYLLIFPILTGLIRLVVSFWNFSLIF